MNSIPRVLNEKSLSEFDFLCNDAINEITNKLNAAETSILEEYKEKNRKACREDIAFHLSCLRPTLESGLLNAYVEYLQWLSEVYLARNIPTNKIEDALHLIGEYFSEKMSQGGDIIRNTLKTAISQVKEPTQDSINNLNTWPEVPAFESALLQGDHKTGSTIINQLLKKGFNLIEIEVLLIEPAMHEIGLKWQKNQVSVVQEHLATATASTLMAQYFTQVKLKPLNGKKAVLACVESNEHMLGLHMISDALQMDGWEVQFLGANTPTQAFVEHIAHIKPDIVGLSISFAYQLMPAREVLKELDSTFPVDCPKLVIGGNAVNRFPELFKSIGADLSLTNALSVKNLLTE